VRTRSSPCRRCQLPHCLTWGGCDTHVLRTGSVRRIRPSSCLPARCGVIDPDGLDCGARYRRPQACVRPWVPAPSTARFWLSGRDSRSTAAPPAAPVRMAVSVPPPEGQAPGPCPVPLPEQQPGCMQDRGPDFRGNRETIFTASASPPLSVTKRVCKRLRASWSQWRGDTQGNFGAAIREAQRRASFLDRILIGSA